MQRAVRRPYACLTLLGFLGALLLSCNSGRVGILFDINGNPLAGTAVVLLSIDDEGDQLSQLDSNITDSNGNFKFKVETAANGSVIVSAQLPNGAQRGFFAGRNDFVPLHPLTEALVALIIDITETSGGRSVLDFSADELRGIAEKVFALNSDSIDLSNQEAVKNFLRTNVGRDIAIAAGGSITALSTEDFEGSTTSSTATFDENTTVCPIGIKIFVLSSTNFRFDIEEDGTICGGTSSSLSNIFAEGAFQLAFPNDTFHIFGASIFPASGTGTAVLEDSREVALGPHMLAEPLVDPPEADDIAITRKVYVPTSGDTIRHLEIFTNSGSSERTISSVEVRSFLETGNESLLLTFDSAASATTPSTSDRFVVAYDAFEDRPTVGLIFQDGLGTLTIDQLDVPGSAGGDADEITFGWTNLSLPANSTTTILHYALLSTSRVATELDQAMQAILTNPDMSGMSRSELAALANFTPRRGTVNGEAGAVIGEASVTAVNQRSSESITLTANSDGSFFIPLDTESSDTIQITASDSLDLVVTVP